MLHLRIKLTNHLNMTKIIKWKLKVVEIKKHGNWTVNEKGDKLEIKLIKMLLNINLPSASASSWTHSEICLVTSSNSFLR